MKIDGKRIIAFIIKKTDKGYVSYYADTEQRINGSECKKTEIAINPANVGRISDLVTNGKFAFVGFGNKYYDNIILNYIIKNKDILSDAGSTSITDMIDNVLDKILNEQDQELEKQYKYVSVFNSFDLQKFLFSKDQQVSLEQFVNASDFKYTDSNHDVDNIVNILDFNKERIEARSAIEEIYNEDLFDAHEGVVCAKLMKSLYARKNSLKRSDLRSVSKSIGKVCLGDIVFPEVSFRTEQMKMFLDELKNETIIVGQDWAKYVSIGKYELIMNLAGLRMNTEPCMLKSDDDGMLYNIDVKSFYPSVLVGYRVKPSQVNDTFIDIYGDMLSKRLEFAASGDEKCSEAMKYMLNGIVGQFMIENSWLYDPVASFKIRINGALLMLMLIEELKDYADIKCVTIDGMLVKSHEDISNVISQWSGKTKLNATVKHYEYAYMLTNNDYITDSTSKGFFSYHSNNGRNNVPNIVKVAVEENLVNGVPVKTTISGSSDIRDYLMSISSNDTLEWNGSIFKNARFYFSNDQKLCKVKDGGYFSEPTLVPVTDCGVTVTDTIGDSFPDNIDYGYYVSEANHIIEKLRVQQLNSFQ